MRRQAAIGGNRSRLLAGLLVLVACASPSRYSPATTTTDTDTSEHVKRVAADSAAFSDRISDINPSLTMITERRLSILRDELLRYRRLRGELPDSLADILELPPSAPSLPNQERWLKDGWERSFRYRVDQQKAFELRSAGADGLFDSRDDIVVRGP